MAASDNRVPINGNGEIGLWKFEITIAFCHVTNSAGSTLFQTLRLTTENELKNN